MPLEPTDRVRLAAAAEETGAALRGLIDQAAALRVMVPFNVVCGTTSLVQWVGELDPHGQRATLQPQHEDLTLAPAGLLDRLAGVLAGVIGHVSEERDRLQRRNRWLEVHALGAALFELRTAHARLTALLTSSSDKAVAPRRPTTRQPQNPAPGEHP